MQSICIQFWFRHNQIYLLRSINETDITKTPNSYNTEKCGYVVSDTIFLDLD